MDKQYDDTNRFVLFQESDKKSESHPDYKGSINIDGQEYWLSGWKKLDRNNKPFLSGSVKPKEFKVDEPVITDADTPISMSDIPF